MEVLERRIAKTTKNLKGDKSLQKELDLLTKISDFLAAGKSARAMDLTEEDDEFVKSLDLLSYKPIIYVANVSEEDAADSADNQYVKAVREFAATEDAEVVVICAEIEQEISELEDEEKSYVPGRAGHQRIGPRQADQSFLPPAESDLLPHSR